MDLIKKAEELLKHNMEEIKEFNKENENFNYDSIHRNLEIAPLLRLVYVRYRLRGLFEKRDRRLMLAEGFRSFAKENK